MRGTILGKAAHEPATVIGIFQTVEEHMVFQTGMTQPGPDLRYDQV